MWLGIGHKACPKSPVGKYVSHMIVCWHHIGGYESHIPLNGPHKSSALVSYSSVWAVSGSVLMGHIWMGIVIICRLCASHNWVLVS